MSDIKWIDEVMEKFESSLMKLRIPDMLTNRFMTAVSDGESPKSIYMIRTSENGYFKDSSNDTEFDVPFNHGTVYSSHTDACIAANLFKDSFNDVKVEAYFITQESSRWSDMDIEHDDVSLHLGNEVNEVEMLKKDF